MTLGEAHGTPRRAVVTGASSGIGRATALRLARDGCDVGITYRDNQEGAIRLREEIHRIGRRAEISQLDLRDPETASSAVGQLAGQLGGIDVLVNAAGVNRRALVADEDIRGWRDTLDVNLVGPWACAHAALPHMIAAGGGRIVNVTSVLASVPLAGGAAYAASKAGLELLTKVMALELADRRIMVNAVAPGHTATPMNFDESILDGSTIERPVIPVRRAADPAEIAEAIAFLVRNENQYTTGASLLVDGGLALCSGPEALQRETGLPSNR